jgi:lactoylglutathione lyase
MTAFTYDHIHLRSPDAEATARWYKNMFGAEVIRSVQSDGRPRLDLNLGGVAVFIAQVPPEQAVAAPPEPPYLGLEHIEACVSTGLTRPSPSSSKRVPNSPWSPRRSGPGFGSLFFAARRTSTSNCWTGTPPDTFPAPRAGRTLTRLAALGILSRNAGEGLQRKAPLPHREIRAADRPNLI